MGEKVSGFFTQRTEQEKSGIVVGGSLLFSLMLYRWGKKKGDRAAEQGLAKAEAAKLAAEKLAKETPSPAAAAPGSVPAPHGYLMKLVDETVRQPADRLLTKEQQREAKSLTPLLESLSLPEHSRVLVLQGKAKPLEAAMVKCAAPDAVASVHAVDGAGALSGAGPAPASVDAIWDRGSTARLPPPEAAEVVGALCKRLRPGGKYFLATLEYESGRADVCLRGPPFSSEIKATIDLFKANGMKGQLKSRESMLEKYPNARAAGVTKLYEVMWVFEKES